jgi:hypothetical protein
MVLRAIKYHFYQLKYLTDLASHPKYAIILHFLSAPGFPSIKPKSDQKPTTKWAWKWQQNTTTTTEEEAKASGRGGRVGAEEAQNAPNGCHLQASAAGRAAGNY